MKIKWKQSGIIEVCNDYNEEMDVGTFEPCTIKDGCTDEVDVFSETETTVDIQFGDGSIAVQIDRTLFEVII